MYVHIIMEHLWKSSKMLEQNSNFLYGYIMLAKKNLTFIISYDGRIVGKLIWGFRGAGFILYDTMEHWKGQ